MCVNFHYQKHSEVLKKLLPELESGVYKKAFFLKNHYLLSACRVSKRFEEGKVYFDEKGTIFYGDEVVYPRGFHASRTGSTIYKGVEYNVMLADIVAVDPEQVAGRIMLIMTEEDYKTYMNDTTSKPIKVSEAKIELEEICVN